MGRLFKVAAVVALSCALPGFARAAHAQQVVTSARVAPVGDALPGPLFVTVGGKEKKVADNAFKAWVIAGGRKVVYSGPDGAGGYENEGQSLRVYDAATAASRKVMSEYFMVDDVTEVTTASKKTALLVAMSDGGLGASYVAVVDPARGEVFFRRWARVISRRGDVVHLGHYRESDWERFNENENAAIKPLKMESVNLNTVLKNRVIVNKRKP